MLSHHTARYRPSADAVFSKIYTDELDAVLRMVEQRRYSQLQAWAVQERQRRNRTPEENRQIIDGALARIRLQQVNAVREMVQRGRYSQLEEWAHEQQPVNRPISPDALKIDAAILSIHRRELDTVLEMVEHRRYSQLQTWAVQERQRRNRTPAQTRQLIDHTLARLRHTPPPAPKQ